jgi:hypothetical protein
MLRSCKDETENNDWYFRLLRDAGRLTGIEKAADQSRQPDQFPKGIGIGGLLMKKFVQTLASRLFITASGFPAAIVIIGANIEQGITKM